jgi:hypothetical protein
MRATVQRRLERLERALGQRTTAASPLLQALRRDPAQLMSRAGIPPDPWQRNLLCSTSPQILLLCSRQVGKSTAVAAVALCAALLQPGSLILLLSPSARQSGELYRKVLELYRALGRPVQARRELELRLELVNGSRIISLPGEEETIRCYSGVRLLVVDEAARVKDALYRAVRPMLAASRGRLIGLSTPFGKLGWFHEAWHSAERWERIRITAPQCPRISHSFLEEERQALGPRWFTMEYMCDFQDIVGQVFAEDDIQAMFRPSAVPALTLNGDMHAG